MLENCLVSLIKPKRIVGNGRVGFSKGSVRLVVWSFGHLIGDHWVAGSLGSSRRNQGGLNFFIMTLLDLIDYL